MVRASHDCVGVLKKVETRFGLKATTELYGNDVGRSSSKRQRMDPFDQVGEFVVLGVQKLVFQVALDVVALYDEASSAHCCLVCFAVGRVFLVSGWSEQGLYV